MSEAKSSRDEIARVVHEALREAPFSLRDLAEDMEGSYGTVREWSRGARTPTDASVERIAASLEGRARTLQRIAERLRRTIGVKGGE
jgi:transcriptional regulator with XRE-family HTH domain